MIAIEDFKKGNTIWEVEEGYEIVSHKIIDIYEEDGDTYVRFLTTNEDTKASYEWETYFLEEDLEQYYNTELEANEVAVEAIRLRYQELYEKKLKSLTEDKQ